MNNQQKAKAARQAIEKTGGISETAAKLTRIMDEDVSYYRVQKWLLNGIPPYFCIPMHELSGMALHEINSELYPKRLFNP